MSKAKELKEAFAWGKKNDLYNLDFPDVDWLIEQAEMVESVEKENVKLMSFKDTLLQENQELTSEKNTLQRINEDLNNTIERYKKALQFYAGKENYEVAREGLNPSEDYIHLIDMDEGDKARKALNS